MKKIISAKMAIEGKWKILQGNQAKHHENRLIE